MKPLFNKKALIIFLTSLLFVLVISNPSETVYLQKVAIDYGAAHHGSTMDSIKSLREMGESARTNYWLFSTYQYRFGNVSVSYFGIGFQIYFIESSSNKSEYNPPRST